MSSALCSPGCVVTSTLADTNNLETLPIKTLCSCPDSPTSDPRPIPLNAYLTSTMHSFTRRICPRGCVLKDGSQTICDCSGRIVAEEIASRDIGFIILGTFVFSIIVYVVINVMKRNRSCQRRSHSFDESYYYDEPTQIIGQRTPGRNVICQTVFTPPNGNQSNERTDLTLYVPTYQNHRSVEDCLQTNITVDPPPYDHNCNVGSEKPPPYDYALNSTQNEAINLNRANNENDNPNVRDGSGTGEVSNNSANNYLTNH